jgi:hypothetical protein
LLVAKNRRLGSGKILFVFATLLSFASELFAGTLDIYQGGVLVNHEAKLAPREAE